MACTIDDISYLQQANEMSKAIPEEYRSAPVKEKWHENGEERTRLHPDVPGTAHDAILLQVAAYAQVVLLKQEELIQQVQDAETEDDVRAVRWN